jgi:hypothetical protein
MLLAVTQTYRFALHFNSQAFDETVDRFLTLLSLSLPLSYTKTLNLSGWILDEKISRSIVKMFPRLKKLVISSDCDKSVIDTFIKEQKLHSKFKIILSDHKTYHCYQTQTIELSNSNQPIYSELNLR